MKSRELCRWVRAWFKGHDWGTPLGQQRTHIQCLRCGTVIGLEGWIGPGKFEWVPEKGMKLMVTKPINDDFRLVIGRNPSFFKKYLDKYVPDCNYIIVKDVMTS